MLKIELIRANQHIELVSAKFNEPLRRFGANLIDLSKIPSGADFNNQSSDSRSLNNKKGSLP